MLTLSFLIPRNGARGPYPHHRCSGGAAPPACHAHRACTIRTRTLQIHKRKLRQIGAAFGQTR